MRARVSIGGTAFDITDGVRSATPHASADRVPHVVLVVDVDLEALSNMCAVLADGGYLVTRASSFAEARRQLVLVRPDVIITAIRLGGFNGLHLVIRSRSTFPDIVAIVTHPGPDPVLQADAAAQEAVWMMNPIDSQLLRDLVARMLHARLERRSTTLPRRWTRRRVADPVAATLGVAQGTVVDVSYGGLRLRLSKPIDGTSQDPQPLAVPLIGVAIRARPVWGRGAGPSGPWWYGIELDEPESDAHQAWRAFVDAESEAVSR
jgi:CheY-like chemotaxis protein